jgi:hypothetical protein
VNTVINLSVGVNTIDYVESGVLFRETDLQFEKFIKP